MRVFVTGATGFIGSAIVRELIAHGHRVVGMARSEAGAKALQASGAEVHRGDLAHPESLRSGAAGAEGVIHCAFDHSAFDHDLSKFIEVCEQDRRAIEALGEALAGSKRPLVVTSGTGMGSRGPGQPATEDHFDATHANPRKASEEAAAALGARGVNVSVMRLPQVHDTQKQGLVTYAVALARAKGVSAMIGEGRNRWPAAHVLDVARLYRLAVEKAEAGRRYHAVAEEGVPMAEIAAAIGEGVGVPVVALSAEEAQAHFGWLAMFAGMDMPASSAQTRAALGWTPVGPGLIEDLRGMRG